jgi:hypothetical protein
LEEWVEVGRQMTLGLLQRMGIETEVEGSVKEGERKKLKIIPAGKEEKINE